MEPVLLPPADVLHREGSVVVDGRDQPAVIPGFTGLHRSWRQRGNARRRQQQRHRGEDKASQAARPRTDEFQLPPPNRCWTSPGRITPRGGPARPGWQFVRVSVRPGRSRGGSGHVPEHRGPTCPARPVDGSSRGEAGRHQGEGRRQRARRRMTRATALLCSISGDAGGVGLASTRTTCKRSPKYGPAVSMSIGARRSGVDSRSACGEPRQCLPRRPRGC